MDISKADIVHCLQAFCDDSSRNRVSEAVALAPGCAGIRMYDWPLVGVSSARDALYKECKRADVVGENHMLPSEWIDSAISVISIFNPFTRQIKASNAGGGMPSLEWLHGRNQGQGYSVAAAQALAEHLRSQCAQAMVPAADKRFKVYKEPKIYSNWSERHTAYIAGLGTFSLNRAIITQQGIAGRFCSVITDIALAADERQYTGLYDNCSLCGACRRACSADAITMHGKAHTPCFSFLEKVNKKYPSYYGCGKCQCGMPCESAVPPTNSKADYSVIKNIDSGN